MQRKVQFSTRWALTQTVKGTPICNDSLVSDSTTQNAKINWFLEKRSSDRALTRKIWVFRISHCIWYVGILIRNLLNMQ